MELAFRFPLIAGSIMGNPNTGDILLERGRVGSYLRLDVERLRNAAARFATPAQPFALDAGLVIQPREARFARFGTFVTKVHSDQDVWYGSFIETETRISLVLLYFDEPCRISGVFRVGGIEAKHSISISSSGLHWIQVKEIAPNRYELENIENPKGVSFGVRPLPAPKAGQGT
jgi:hypothetical protein